jgi:plastocyanin
MGISSKKPILRACLWLTSLCLSSAVVSAAQEAPVTANVQVVKGSASNHAASSGTLDASNVVVWLIPVDRAAQTAPVSQPQRPTPQLVQHNKSIEPHLLVVEVGSTVQFPNRDPFFHNIFSLYEGKAFDLGLYEAGSTRSVRFDRPGVSFLFCNIHAEMSAVVVAVETPYFSVSNRSGHLEIANVPDGRYMMHVWSERSLPEDLKGLTRTVTISESARSLDPIRVIDNPNFTLAHKNKYGQDYVPPPEPGYLHP